jgi:uncharacterized protein with HEPN domain
MLNASLLSIIEEAGLAVLILTEGLEKEEFLNSRLTRAEVVRQVKIIAGIAGKLPSQTCTLMAEVDWDGWAAMARQLDKLDSAAGEALWFAVRSMMPATVMWLRVYQKNQPELFDFTPQDNQERQD